MNYWLIFRDHSENPILNRSTRELGMEKIICYYRSPIKIFMVPDLDLLMGTGMKLIKNEFLKRFCCSSRNKSCKLGNDWLFLQIFLH